MARRCRGIGSCMPKPLKTPLPPGNGGLSGEAAFQCKLCAAVSIRPGSVARPDDPTQPVNKDCSDSPTPLPAAWSKCVRCSSEAADVQSGSVTCSGGVSADCSVSSCFASSARLCRRYNSMTRSRRSFPGTCPLDSIRIKKSLAACKLLASMHASTMISKVPGSITIERSVSWLYIACATTAALDATDKAPRRTIWASLFDSMANSEDPSALPSGFFGGGGGGGGAQLGSGRNVRCCSRRLNATKFTRLSMCMRAFFARSASASASASTSGSGTGGGSSEGGGPMCRRRSLRWSLWSFVERSRSRSRSRPPPRSRSFFSPLLRGSWKSSGARSSVTRTRLARVSGTASPSAACRRCSSRSRL
mmetsp:Transcript_107698/g.314888  ORF Transcript_107698/g.314888 Transcript_107698/m.314888 type:complete len:362 (+) Transcript_107698:342-1427(+)